MTLPTKGQTLVIRCDGCQRKNRVVFEFSTRYRCAACGRPFAWEQIKRVATSDQMFGSDMLSRLEQMFRGL